MRPLLRNFKSSINSSGSIKPSTNDTENSSNAQKTTIDLNLQSRLQRPIVNAFDRLKSYGSRNPKSNIIATTSEVDAIETNSTFYTYTTSKVFDDEQPMVGSNISEERHSIGDIRHQNPLDSSENNEGTLDSTFSTNVDIGNDQDDRSEAVSLAQRIQALITSSMARIYSNLDNVGSEQAHVEPRMASILSSISIMNGSLSQGRESVWSILDRLRFSPSSSASVINDSSSIDAESMRAIAGTIGDDSSFEDTSSLMLYSPLIPDSDSQVEVARSEIISFDDGITIDTRATVGDDDVGSINDIDMIHQSNEINDKATTPAKTGSKKGKEKIVWVPSITKISLQATWWGYRIYLPPPVIAVLNNQSVEAANRAAIITTALKWLLDNIPTSAVPPQLRLALVTLRQLVPIIGYVGTFIGWSWKAVKGFDKGYGVILSATWLLPIAPIPGTWEEADFPKSTDENHNHTDQRTVSR